MRQWDGLVEEYLRGCEAKGLAQVTVVMRRRELERWGSWLKRRRPHVELGQVEPEHIIRYIQGRTAFRTKSTLRSIISHMRGFGEHLAGGGHWRQNPLRWIQGPKADPRARVPRRIRREDLKRLWGQAAGSSNAYQRHLRLALLACLYGTGIRRGELERLNLDSWNREEGVLRIDGRKTGQERLQPVSESIWRCIEGYLPHRQNVLEKAGRLQERALFIGRSGRRMKGESIGIALHRLARKAGIPLVTLHQFRHT